MYQSRDDAISIDNEDTSKAVWQQYFSMMRPITIIQAVGAFLVGTLVILLSQQQQLQTTESILMNQSSTLLQQIIMASTSIYCSYGAGMAMNDCADASVDSQHTTKQSRSIASEAISIKNGWIFCIVLSMISLVFASIANSSTNSGYFGFVPWTALNLLLMAGYALGMQKLFLVKNILCGFFAISPLVGASTLFGSSSMDTLLLGGGSDITMKLYQLAAIGFPFQVSREILKDIEDVDVDRGEKQTLPLVVGEVTSKRIAYGLVGIVNGVMLFSPYYWNMFASIPPVYALSVAIGTPMCIAASRMPLVKGQKLLKKSIYVLLSGMISGLLLQSLSA